MSLFGAGRVCMVQDESAYCRLERIMIRLIMSLKVCPITGKNELDANTRTLMPYRTLLAPNGDHALFMMKNIIVPLTHFRNEKIIQDVFMQNTRVLIKHKSKESMTQKQY
jgi:hypothetical protein